MRFLSKIFGREAKPAARAEPEPGLAPVSKGEVVTADPQRFAEWIFVNLVEMMTDEMAEGFCADAEAAERWGITADEQKAAKNEIIIMMALGSCMFTGLNQPMEYHRDFKSELSKHVSKKLYGGWIGHRINEVEEAIDLYLEDLIDKTKVDEIFSLFSYKYLERVYASNPNWLAMYRGAEIAKAPLDLVLSGLKLTGESYEMLTGQGR